MTAAFCVSNINTSVPTIACNQWLGLGGGDVNPVGLHVLCDRTGIYTYGLDPTAKLHYQDMILSIEQVTRKTVNQENFDEFLDSTAWFFEVLVGCSVVVRGDMGRGHRVVLLILYCFILFFQENAVVSVCAVIWGDGIVFSCYYLFISGTRLTNDERGGVRAKEDRRNAAARGFVLRRSRKNRSKAYLMSSKNDPVYLLSIDSHLPLIYGVSIYQRKFPKNSLVSVRTSSCAFSLGNSSRHADKTDRVQYVQLLLLYVTLCYYYYYNKYQ